jgi:2-C-methyl-D-erythritol 2,4-cyclodiphosphate synthase
MKIRTGFGLDVHAFAESRKLILGGIEIPYAKGLLGHSDADVLTHAIMDALLGAAAEGDIGKHFPDTSLEFKGAFSMDLLKKTMEIVRNKGYEVNNIDATVAAERPKLAGYINEMVNNYAQVMKLSPEDINVKATTTEKLGFTGREEGIAAFAVCTIYKMEESK